ncbi:MAG: YcfL family protein [Plesiomonas shigelloides]
MKMSILGLFLGLMTVGMVGCANNTAGLYASSGGEYRVDSRSLARDVAIGKLTLSYSGSLVKAHAELQSKLSQDQNLQYRFSWYDKDSLLVDGDSTGWQALRLHGMQAQQVTAVAPNPSATRFEIYVRKAYSN